MTKVGTHNQSIYELLKKYPSPYKIQRARLSSLLKINHLKTEKALLIYEKAKTAVGLPSNALEFELLQTIQLIELFKQTIIDIDKEIKQLMSTIESPIESIPGISTILGSIILAEIKDIHNFRTPAQLLAFSGLEPSVRQSGLIENEGKIVKRGSTHLRWALIQATKSIARWSPTFNSYLSKKLAQGKHYNVAVSHVAKKLVRIIFHLLKNHKNSDESTLT